MITKNISHKNFAKEKKNFKLYKDFIGLIKNSNNSELLKSLGLKYKYNFNKKKILKLKKNKSYRIFGMGGSILGARAIYDFLKDRIKKEFFFVDNIYSKKNWNFKKKNINLIISKSGNTLETIVNSNLYLNKNDKNLIITENGNSPILKLAASLKAEIIEHNNFIGGRYSVLSEVGMVPAILMGLKENKFKRFNYLIKNKKFTESLISNVASIISLLKRGYLNSIILNYDEKSESLFKWYQQLIGESLGKKSKGILPVISSMPMDNHSLMQFYLDGPKKSFFTFFSVNENNSKIIKKKNLPTTHKKLINLDINKIIKSQKEATESIFKKEKIPFRTFNIKNRSEEVLGELFCFFILETILLGRFLNVNPFDQPSVELIKKETKKILF
tara:strand:+ start:5954 stop:7114 length:1161 start_codon:yes stop_codon:yes gene_type:complete